MARIVSIGSALQDVYLIDRDDLTATPIGTGAIFGDIMVGSTVDIDRITYEVGGGGLNAAISLARHGHETILIGNIGRDSAGEAIIEKLDYENIDSSYINILGRKNTGTSVILLDKQSGERTILACRSAAEQFSNFDENDLELVRPDWLYVTTMYGDIETLKRFFKKAKSMGTRVVFSPGPKELASRKGIVELLKYTDALILNKREAMRTISGATLQELLYHLKNYADITIITDGAMGGIASDGAESYRFGIYEDIKVKDATGAGEAFGAGFLAHYAAGASFKDALVFASANATSVVSKVGASSGALTGRESLHLMPIQKI